MFTKSYMLLIFTLKQHYVKPYDRQEQALSFAI